MRRRGGLLRYGFAFDDDFAWSDNFLDLAHLIFDVL